MPRREELAWAAGFYEGDGTIGCYGKGHGLHMKVVQVDPEPALKFHEVVGVGRISGPIHQPSHTPNQRPYFMWRVSSFEHVQAVVAMLWPWLSCRRKDQARKALAQKLGIFEEVPV